MSPRSKRTARRTAGLLLTGTGFLLAAVHAWASHKARRLRAETLDLIVGDVPTFPTGFRKPKRQKDDYR